MDHPVIDDNLILRMGGGDAAAFSELYEKTSSAVYGFALSILRNRQDAEDVMHDTYIRVYSGAAAYKPAGKALTWMMTIVKNLCYSRLRDGKILQDIDDLELAADHSMQEIAEDRQILETAMQILSFDERQIVVLHAVTGMKHREIAEILSLPAGTVVSKYNRALRKMRTEIERKWRQDDGQ
jgi:RNA polymerase sigma-70 factor (ECF subfamily)